MCDIKKGRNHYCTVEGDSFNVAAVNTRRTMLTAPAQHWQLQNDRLTKLQFIYKLF